MARYRVTGEHVASNHRTYTANETGTTDRANGEYA
jgi:hypothetical protein